MGKAQVKGCAKHMQTNGLKLSRDGLVGSASNRDADNESSLQFTEAQAL